VSEYVSESSDEWSRRGRCLPACGVIRTDVTESSGWLGCELESSLRRE
jgi:hypothetical protein